MAKQTAPPLPLSKGWPRHVRSAAVHAIALARLALTTARPELGKLPRRDDLYRVRTFTCWNNESFTAHLGHYTGKSELAKADGVSYRDRRTRRQHGMEEW